MPATILRQVTGVAFLAAMEITPCDFWLLVNRAALYQIVSCAKTGRRFVGIELDPVHFDNACERISEALKQGALFDHAHDSNEQARFPLE